MFSEGHKKEDFLYLHFVVILFRSRSAAINSLTFRDCDVKLNKQYWSLITNVDDYGVSAVFVDDSNQEVHCKIQYHEMKNDTVTVYIFRTPDEEMALLNYKADKIADILERTVLKYDDHPRRSEDERFQTILERSADEKYIRELCQEEGLYNPDNHDTLKIEWLHWKPGHQYRVYYSQNAGTRNGVSFNVNIGGQILGPSE